ncbi:MAG: N-acetylglucosamine-6-phosphate deacetylase [Alicyclobacillus sp.]|nr:N-acetylglucosamine-6-phosphate deacetylase [Alicyclobacillus sp.]
MLSERRWWTRWSGFSTVPGGQEISCSRDPRVQSHRIHQNGRSRHGAGGGVVSNLVIANARIVTPDGLLPAHPRHAVVVKDGIIASVGAWDGRADWVLDGRGGFVIPGCIDLHVHGAAGYDLMEGSAHSVDAVSLALARRGCTSFLATSVTASFSDLMRFIDGVKAVAGREPGARILGIHLEGPYLNRRRKGMQNEAQIRNPDVGEMAEFLDAAQGLIRMVTLAPELPGADVLIRFLRDRGVVVAMAHSEASYDEAKAAFTLGVTHVTHCFNAMPSIHHREPGPVVAAWEEPAVTCEAIVDNVHLHPAIVRLMYRNLGRDKMALVTDAMQAMGLGDGDYHFGGHWVQVRDGVARLADGTLASSTVTMTQAIRHAVANGLSLTEAVYMAATTPAQILGMGQKGRIAPGCDADLVICDESLEVVSVLIGGEVLEG